MVAINGTCYWNSRRCCQSCTVLMVTRTCYSRIAPQHTALATLFGYCSRRLQSSLHPTCGRQTAQTWTRSTSVCEVLCRNEFTRLQCVTQLTSSGASLRLGRTFRSQSSTKPLTSGGYDYEPASKQRDVTSSTRWRCNQPALFRATKCYHTTTSSCQSHPHFIEENSYAFVCLNISNIR